MSTFDSKVIYYAVRVLNEALEQDRAAIERLFAHRVSVNETLASHPTIQVSADRSSSSLGVLGLINGLFGVDSHGIGFIAAEVDDQDPYHILRFIIRDPNI